MENDLNKHLITDKTLKTIKIVEKILKKIESDLKRIGAKKKLNPDEIESTCSKILHLTFSLEASLDMDAGGEIAKNLKELYHHVRFAVVRVRDEGDYSFIPSATRVISEINTGWGEVSDVAFSAAS